jgi:hypothetical protein
MKKIILILGLVLLVSSVVFAGNYNPETYEYTWDLKQGWNLVPAINTFPPEGYSNTADFFSQCNLGYFFMWNPIVKEYFGGNYLTSKTVGTPVTDTTILSTNQIAGAYWIYSNNYCNLNNTWGTYPMSWSDDYKPQVETTLRLVEGWNFIAINPYMIGTTLPEVYSSCDVVKANHWDATSQNWMAQASIPEFVTANEQPITKDNVGQVFVVKVASDCYLNYGSGTISPPVLPN